jgi:hypothetical protein
VKTTKKRKGALKATPKWRYVAIAVGVICSSFVVGYQYGKASSPKYATETDALKYTYNHATIEFSF